MYFRNRQPGFVGLISRPKLAGPGRHAGVLLPDGRVAHKGASGTAIVSLEEFKQGLEIQYGVPVPAALHMQVLHRARESIGRTPPYHVLNRNCEHYATWLLTGKAESPQVNGLMFLALLGAFVYTAN